MDLTALTAQFRRITFADTGTYSDTDVKDALNEGMRLVYTVDRWPFLSKEVDFATVAGTAEYRIAAGQAVAVADMMYFGSVFKKNAKELPLEQIQPDVARNLYGSGTGVSQGEPKHVALLTRASLNYVVLFPRPSAAVTYVFQYYYIPADLSAGTDTPQWDYTLHQILVDWAAYRFYLTIQEQQNAREHLKLFQGGIADLKAYYNRRSATTPWIFGNGLATSAQVNTNLGGILI